MRIVATNKPLTATVELSAGELLLLFAGLVEANEALSPGEYLARVGSPQSESEDLVSALKDLIGRLSSPS